MLRCQIDSPFVRVTVIFSLMLYCGLSYAAFTAFIVGGALSREPSCVLFSLRITSAAIVAYALFVLFLLEGREPGCRGWLRLLLVAVLQAMLLFSLANLSAVGVTVLLEPALTFRNNYFTVVSLIKYFSLSGLVLALYRGGWQITKRRT